MFDNDEPGIKAMIKYEKLHGTKQVLLQMEKDLSDSVKKHGVNMVRNNVLPLIKKALYE